MAVTYKGYTCISTVRVGGVKVVLDELPPDKKAETSAKIRGEFAQQFGESVSRRPDEAQSLLKDPGAGFDTAERGTQCLTQRVSDGI